MGSLLEEIAEESSAAWAAAKDIHLSGLAEDMTEILLEVERMSELG
jgi:hypothetical protein